MLSPQMQSLLNQNRNSLRPKADHTAIAGSSPRRPSGSNTNDRRLLLVLMMVEDNFRRQLVISDLAMVVNLSPGRLAHLFKSEIGVSPRRYLNNMRLEKARECLENGVLSVKEIASEVGMPSVSHFCRLFKAQYGTTPGEYRKTHLRMDSRSVAAEFRVTKRHASNRET